MPVAVKICGLTTRQAVEAAAEYGAQFLGFVFFDASPRNLTPEAAAALKQGLPPTIKTVAVTVDASDELLNRIKKHLNPDYIQFHGKESPEHIAAVKARLKTGVIKALKVRSGDDVAKAGLYGNVVDYLMFDAKAPESGNFLPGGNGLSFDWMLLAGKNFGVPWFLSGGLTKDNVVEAVRISGAKLVDVSSGVEKSPGVKSPVLIQEFMNEIARI